MFGLARGLAAGRAIGWRFAGASAALVCLTLLVSLYRAIGQPAVAVHVLGAHLPVLASFYVDAPFGPVWQRGYTSMVNPIGRNEPW